MTRGTIERDAGRYDQAIEDFGKLIQLKPSAAIGYSGRASVRDMQHDYAAAVADYQESLKLEPDHELSSITLPGCSRPVPGPRFAMASEPSNWPAALAS